MRISTATALVALSASASANTVIIGDSLFAVGGWPPGGSKVPQWLETWSGHQIDNHAVVGASMHEGWVKSIPAQYNDIIGGGAPTTIVMDGGGNDVISVRDDCQAFNDKCRQVIGEAADMAAALLDRMDKDGVQHVLYLGFYYIQGLSQAADYGTEKLKAACDGAKIDCHFADARNLGIVLGSDGLHPTDEGYKTLAEALWQQAQDHGVPV